MAKHWTAEENEFIQKNWVSMSDDELASTLNRSSHAVANQRSRLGLLRNPSLCKQWSNEEMDMLAELWGSVPAPQIAKRLGRTTFAVTNKAASLGLYDQRGQGDMMSLEQVTQMLGLKNTSVVAGWKKDGLRYTRAPINGHTGRRVAKQTHYIFRMKHVLEWLEAHPDKWDSRRIPLYGLGVEYPWLTEKRKQDAALPPIKRPWTDYELSYLKMQVERGVPYSAIAKELGRSKRSAKCQGHQLGLVSGSRA